jgi:hypothetical protein
LNPKEKFQSFENEASLGNQKSTKKKGGYETVEERLQAEIEVMKVTIKNNREELKVLVSISIE